MTGYLIRRVGQALIVILGVILITFLLAQLIPGGEAKAVLGSKATPATVARFNRANGLDLPIYDQFWRYIEGIFVHLNLGYSYKYNQGVTPGHRGAPAEDPDPGGCVGAPLPDRRHPPRHPPGGPAQQADRLRR